MTRAERSARGAARAVWLGLSLGLLATVASLAVLLVVVPKATGSTPLTVLTSSMEPALPPGTLVVVRPVDPSQVEVGDVVTYQVESGRAAVVTHRVVGVQLVADGTRALVLRGDANAAVDAEPVLPVQVRGVVWYSVPLLGHVLQVVGGEGREWVATTVGLGALAYAGGGFALMARRRLRSGRRRRHGRRASADA